MLGLDTWQLAWNTVPSATAVILMASRPLALKLLLSLNAMSPARGTRATFVAVGASYLGISGLERLFTSGHMAQEYLLASMKTTLAV